MGALCGKQWLSEFGGLREVTAQVLRLLRCGPHISRIEQSRPGSKPGRAI